MSTNPIPYNQSVEHPEADEAAVAQQLAETMLGISKKVYDDTGHANRSVHLKSHALLFGEMTVAEGLPEYLAQGLFAKGGTYPVTMRFSSTPGDLLPDAVSTPRGLAIKVTGMDGDFIPSDQNPPSQDFLMVNGPAFQAPNAKAFLKNLKLLAATTDKGEGAKAILSKVLRGTEKIIEAAGGSSGKIRGMGGEPATHPLGETYFTQVPLLYGAYMGKVSLAPVSPDLQSLKGKEINVDDDPYALRMAMLEYFANKGGEWDVKVQLCTDLKTMPIEDASVPWPEEKSPYMTVARIKVGPQKAWDDERSSLIDDSMSFSPWHCLAAHRPIGSVMRVRKLAYEMSAQYRLQKNGRVGASVNTCPIHNGTH